MRDVHVRMIADITVSPDGRRLTNIVHDPVRNTTNIMVAVKE